MAAILGISAFFHDAAAALVIDGQIVAAAQEERFTRQKHDARFPTQAIEYCLAEAGLTVDKLDYVGFYEKPLRKFDRLLETYLSFAPRGFRSFAAAIPVWLKEKLHLRQALKEGLRGFNKQFVFAEHHESHAASAFYPSPFEEAAILTVDGVGEWATAAFGVGRQSKIELTHELRFPHSLGLLYSAFTAFCGFRVNSGEHKLMGLAPYGEPRFADLIRERLIDLKEDGSFWIDQSYFRYCDGVTMTSKKFERLFGGPPRQPESTITEREMDLAASIQAVTEEIMLRIGRHVYNQTGLKRLCMAGGVALNCVANGKLLRDGPFDEIWIQPASGDAGGALGVALFIGHQLVNEPRTVTSTDSQRGSLLGPTYPETVIQDVLDAADAKYRRFGDDQSLCEYVAGLLEQGYVVGWFQGRMEFGPRALGNRSILADPRDPQMQRRLNEKIKFRESFRPLAPAVLLESADEHFDLPKGSESPYMLLVAPVREAKRIQPPPLTANSKLASLHAVRSAIPAVTHVDDSARVQTVDCERNQRFHRLMSCFAAKTGVPVLINTSFNVRGEPIVCSPVDAYRGFMATGMDVLVLERFVLLKSDQPEQSLRDANSHRGQFRLD